MKFIAITFIFGIFLESNARLIHRSNKISIAGQRDNRPTVTGHRPCGGPGRLLDYKDDGCDDMWGHCRYYTERSPQNSQVVFAPSRDINQLGIRVSAFRGPVFMEQVIPNSAVRAGNAYSLWNEYVLEQDLRGARGIARLELYNTVNGNVEICLEWPLDIV